MLTYGFNVWIEATIIPFLAVMSGFLFFRYKTKGETNVRFRHLTLSTFFVTLLEVTSTLLIDGWGHQHTVNLLIRSMYYVVLNVNAYHFMRYVQAYVKIEDKKFDMFNTILIISSLIVVLLNLTPYFSGFFFKVANDGGLYRGSYNTLWRSVYALYFIIMAGYLQLANKEAYPSKHQYMIMNILGLILVLSFVIQYMFIRDVLFTYTVACIVLYIIFFYYEAPIYRRMNTIEKELKESREAAVKSMRQANRANNAKSEFMANMSRDITIPINTVLELNELMMKSSNDPLVINAAKDIKKAGEHLQKLIDNILEISETESQCQYYPGKIGEE